MAKQRNTIKKLNTENIEVGKMYAYKDLCAALDLPVKVGNSKKTQIEEINRFMKLTYKAKEKKYKVMNIYDKAKAEIKKDSSNSIYSKYLGHIILKSLENKPGNKICMSITPLCNEFGFINQNYTKYYYNRDALLKQLNDRGINISMFDINYIYEMCNKKFNEIIESSLKGLQRRKLIDWSKPRILYKKDKKTGEIYIEEASNVDTEILIKIEREILLSYGYDDERDVYLRGHRESYQKKCNEAIYELTKEEPLFDYIIVKYWKAYKINYCQDIIPQALEADKIKINKMCLNAEVMNFFKNKTNELDDKYVSKRDNAIIAKMFLDQEKEEQEEEKRKKELKDGELKEVEIDKEIEEKRIDTVNNVDEIVDYFLKDNIVTAPAEEIDFDKLFLEELEKLEENPAEELNKIKDMHNNTYNMLIKLDTKEDIYEVLKKEKYNSKRRGK